MPKDRTPEPCPEGDAIEFVEVPPYMRATRRSFRPAIVAELQKRPGQWAIVERGVTSGALTKQWKQLGCEAVSRKDPTGSGLNIYARWPEGPSDEAA